MLHNGRTGDMENAPSVPVLGRVYLNNKVIQRRFLPRGHRFSPFAIQWCVTLGGILTTILGRTYAYSFEEETVVVDACCGTRVRQAYAAPIE